MVVAAAAAVNQLQHLVQARLEEMELALVQEELVVLEILEAEMEEEELIMMVILIAQTEYHPVVVVVEEVMTMEITQMGLLVK